MLYILPATTGLQNLAPLHFICASKSRSYVDQLVRVPSSPPCRHIPLDLGTLTKGSIGLLNIRTASVSAVCLFTQVESSKNVHNPVVRSYNCDCHGDISVATSDEPQTTGDKRFLSSPSCCQSLQMDGDWRLRAVAWASRQWGAAMLTPVKCDRVDFYVLSW
jgi:hypothetical protein